MSNTLSADTSAMCMRHEGSLSFCFSICSYDLNSNEVDGACTAHMLSSSLQVPLDSKLAIGRHSKSTVFVRIQTDQLEEL